MYWWSWRSSFVALLIVAHTCLAARPVQGGAILDWLFGPSPSANEQVVAYYAPTTTYYPVQSTIAYASQVAPNSAVAYRVATPTTAYRPQAFPSSCSTTVGYRSAPTTCCSPTVVYQAPQNMCPQPVACPPQPTQSRGGLFGSCFRQGTTSASRTSYRTAWQRVPVTSYRPITSNDPVTGCPVTVMKPCTTYTWQPERRRCGFFDRLFGRCDPDPATSACPPNPCVTSQCVAGPSCCGAGAPMMAPGMAAPTPAAPPYYSPNPAGPPPGSSVLPPNSSVGPTLAPQGAPPAVPPGTGAPADSRPSLVPGSESGVTAPQSSTSAHWGPSLNNALGANAKLAGPEMTELQQSPPPTATPRGIVPLPAQGNSTATPGNIRPVPGPDATPTHIDNNKSAAPQLLDPRDRVANAPFRQAWAVTAISWPKQQPVAKQPTRRTLSPRQSSLDDGGWYSIAQ